MATVKYLLVSGCGFQKEIQGTPNRKDKLKTQYLKFSKILYHAFTLMNKRK